MRFPKLLRGKEPGVGDEAPSGEAVLGREAPRRRALTGSLQILVVVVLILAALIFARGPDSSEQPDFTMMTDTTTKPLVSVVRPEPRSTTLSVSVTGTITVRNRVALTPQITGRVASVSPLLRPGGAFAAGEQLLRIEARDFQLALRQAQADIANAVSTLKLRVAEGDAARQNYAILNPGERVPPLVAKVPQIEQARAQLAAARARADIAALDLSRTRFSLPFAGRITSNTAEVGQLLSRGQPFAEAFALDSVEVVAPIAPDDLARIAPAEGRVALVHVDAASLPAGSRNASLTARVERVSAELDERTRFARIYLNFDEPTGRAGRERSKPLSASLPPGTFVDLDINGPLLPGTFELPDAADQLNGQVWVVTDGRLEGRTPVMHGRRQGSFVVDAFEYGTGIVIGAVPAAREGLEVDTAELGT